MSTDLTLRPATPRDAAEVAAVYAAARAAAVPAMPPALRTAEEDRAWFAATLTDGRHEAWLAEQGEALVGFALLTPTWLDALYVSPVAQRTGVGAALLDVVKSVLPGGFGLWVFESNDPARSFYRRHGLVELGCTDGSGNEEGRPDVEMVWPGAEPLVSLRSMIDEVDAQVDDLLARRAALVRAVQDGHGQAVSSL